MSEQKSERRKFTNDVERMQALREYHQKYYNANAALIKERAKAWRIEHGQLGKPGRPKKVVNIAAAALAVEN